MALQEEIDSKSKEINTDGYPMSIGEVMSLYKEGDLDIHPEFQRFFRWSLLQKTKLIESILLGIPIPSIFVSQRDDGVWDVIDGLQRLSTIFEFVGILKDKDRNILPSSKLVKTNYLPSLEGKLWDDKIHPENSLTDVQKRIIKRQKLDIKIIKKESDPNARFELFQRLNTLGTKLTDQEVRNCLLLMINKEFYNWVKDLSDYQPFLNCINISEKSLIEKFHQELVLRFFVFKNSSVTEIRKYEGIAEFITEKVIEFTKSNDFNFFKEANIFKKTFDLLNKTLGENSFKKYDLVKNRLQGQFLISSFESVAVGLGKNIFSWVNIPVTKELKEKFEEKVKSLWTDPNYLNNVGSGSNYMSRIPAVIPIGERVFKNEIIN
ncbi:hypothetical protein CL620_03385 [archaeon]|nr:hypothetical protein [archaeon]